MKYTQRQAAALHDILRGIIINEMVSFSAHDEATALFAEIDGNQPVSKARPTPGRVEPVVSKLPAEGVIVKINTKEYQKGQTVEVHFDQWADKQIPSYTITYVGDLWVIIESQAGAEHRFNRHTGEICNLEGCYGRIVEKQ